MSERILTMFRGATTAISGSVYDNGSHERHHCHGERNDTRLGSSNKSLWSWGGRGSIPAPYSNAVSNFTSDIVIVYNDGDSTDTALASSLQTVSQKQ